MASTSTTTALDTKSKPVKEKRKKDTERMARENGRGGERLIKKKRMVDDEEEDGDVIPSKNEKKRMEMDVENVDSTHAGLKKKRKRAHEDGHASTSTRTAKQADNNRHLPKAKSIRRSSSAIYSSKDEDDLNPSHTTSAPDSPLDPETAALHSQICGLLIEMMAMSRASSLLVSSI
jgi:hypothetical protein